MDASPSLWRGEPSHAPSHAPACPARGEIPLEKVEHASHSRYHLTAIGGWVLGHHDHAQVMRRGLHQTGDVDRWRFVLLGKRTSLAMREVREDSQQSAGHHTSMASREAEGSLWGATNPGERPRR